MQVLRLLANDLRRLFATVTLLLLLQNARGYVRPSIIRLLLSVRLIADSAQG
jgi:hypothetical protein